jgi:hypothetical protein
LAPAPRHTQVPPTKPCDMCDLYRSCTPTCCTSWSTSQLPTCATRCVGWRPGTCACACMRVHASVCAYLCACGREGRVRGGLSTSGIKAVCGYVCTPGGSVGGTPAYRGAQSATRFCVESVKICDFTLSRIVAARMAGWLLSDQCPRAAPCTHAGDWTSYSTLLTPAGGC